jgi:hypothetical protein
MEKLDQISQVSYIPSNGDILRAYTKSTKETGLVQECFTIYNVSFQLYDFNRHGSTGINSLIKMFGNGIDKAVMFVVDVSAYDITLNKTYRNDNLAYSSKKQHLPGAILLKITDFIHIMDAARMSRVCKSWNEILCSCLKPSALERSLSLFDEVSLCFHSIWLRTC